MNNNHDFENIKFKDLELFLTLSQTLNIRELSRKTELNPSQISKTICKLEVALGAKLFNRSTLGLSLSTEGQAQLPKILKIYKSLIELRGEDRRLHRSTITIASSSFFVSHLVPKLIHSFDKEELNVLEVPPEDYFQVGLRSGFSVCIHTSKLDWPSTWHSEEIGEIQYKLYAHKGHSLFAKKSLGLKDIESHPFVKPVYWTREGMKVGDDNFPKTFKRQSSHKTSTAFSAAAITSQSIKHLCYLPSLIAQSFANLKEVETKHIRPLNKKVYVTVKADEVSQNFHKKFIFEAQRVLSEAD